MTRALTGICTVRLTLPDLPVSSLTAACYISRAPCPTPRILWTASTGRNCIWLTGILKDACRERLEKNLVSQAFEERLYQRGPVEGRLDPRPFLKIWEPRYRKFLEVATELYAQMEGDDAQGCRRRVCASSSRAATPSRGTVRSIFPRYD